MVAASSDFFTKVGNPGSATTLSAPGHSIGGTTFNVGSTANWSTDTGIVFAVDQYTTQTVNGVPTSVRTPGTYTEWEGVVASSTQISGAVIRYGSDQNYPAGATTRVYIPVASSRENRLVDGILTSINQDGTLRPASVSTAITASPITSGQLASSSVTTAAVANGAITTPKVNFSAGIVSYTNPGTGGGVFNYINLGGLKMLWGYLVVSGSVTPTAYGLTFPVGLFTDPPTVTATVGPNATTNDQVVNIGTTITITGTSFNILTPSGTTGPERLQVMVMGN